MDDGKVIDWRQARKRAAAARSHAAKKTAQRHQGEPKPPGATPLEPPAGEKDTPVPLRRSTEPSATAAKNARRKRARGLSLCRAGRHRWAVDNDQPFDVASGKLITRRVCRHCGKVRVNLD